MLWSQIHDTYLEGVDALPSLVEQVPDFTLPGLGKWDIAGLCGHLIRAVRTPVTYLATPEPAEGPAGGASDYYVRYLKQRELDPQGFDAAVATRAIDEFNGVDPRHFPQEFRQSAAAVRAALLGIHGEHKVETPHGVFRLQDYLRTRNLEVVVHSIDVARAAGLPWQPPDTAIGEALLLLTEISRAQRKGDSLLMALTGRSYPDDEALPILR